MRVLRLNFFGVFVMTYQFRNARILIVDDMPPMLTLTSSILRIFGFENVETATDADEAFTTFCKFDPDLVITDWQMEPYDGLELVRKMRTSRMSPNRFVPVIMMTGYSHRIRVEASRDAGVTEFLVKPFKAKDLYARIEQLIEKPRQFVEADEFFGPDRRRRKAADYKGPRRRGQDDKDSSDPNAKKILRDLKQQTRDTSKQ